MSDLPDGWAWTDLAKVCTSITDGDHQAPPQVSHGIPFLVIGNIRNGKLDFNNCRHVPAAYIESLNNIRRPQKGDVLYSLVGSYGISALVKEDTPFCVQRHIGILRPSHEISSAYLALALSSRAVFDQATEYATGTAQMTVPLSGLRRISIPLPPRPEQERIVGEADEQFSRIDAGVLALRRTSRNIELMQEAILEEAVTTWTGNSPEIRLADILREPLRNGHSAKADPQGTVPILSLTAITLGDFRSHNIKMTAADPQRVRNLWIQPDDLLIERANTPELVGTTRLYRGLPDLAVYPDLVIRARVNERVLPAYAELALRAPRSRRYFQRKAQGISGSMPKIDQRTIEDLVFTLPPLDIQAAIVQRADQKLTQLRSLQAALKSATILSSALGSSILAAALSGQVYREEFKS